MIPPCHDLRHRRRAARRRRAPARRRDVPRRRRRPGRAGRPQRRRQDDADQGAGRRDGAGRRTGPARRPGRLPAAGPAHRRSRRAGPRPHPLRARARRGRARDAARAGADGQHRPRRPRRRDAAVRPARERLPHQGRVCGRGGSRLDRVQPRAARSGPDPTARDAVRRSAPADRARPDLVLRRRDAAAGRADEPPRRGLDRLAARLPALAQGRARGDQPRRRAARDEREPGVPPRREPAAARRLQRRAGRRISSSARPTSAAVDANGPTPSGRRPRCRCRRTRCGPRRPRRKAAQGMQRRAERLLAGLADERRSDQVARLRFPAPAPCGKTPLTARGLSKSYGSLEIFTDVDLAVDRGSRVVVLGLNGAGKTTLLRILAGVDPPDTGVVAPGHGLRIGYYAQEHETLDPDRTVLENLQAAAPDLPEVEARRVLGSFLFSGDAAAKPARVLSGGEKTRLALATLVVSSANVLLLDEPTNNLDPASRRGDLGRAALVRGRGRARHARRGRRHARSRRSGCCCCRTASKTSGTTTTRTSCRSRDHLRGDDRAAEIRRHDRRIRVTLGFVCVIMGTDRLPAGGCNGRDQEGRPDRGGDSRQARDRLEEALRGW